MPFVGVKNAFKRVMQRVGEFNPVVAPEFTRQLRHRQRCAAINTLRLKTWGGVRGGRCGKR